MDSVKREREITSHMFNTIVNTVEIHRPLNNFTSIAKKVYAGFSSRRKVNWFSSVPLFNWHLCFPPSKGPTLIDTQLGSI